MLPGMSADGTVVDRLSDRDCLRLLASVPVGRIIYTLRALPAVEPVNFVLDNGDIVIRTDSGGKLAAAIRHAVVAFEVDEIDYATRTGWSVTVVGTSREVSDPDEAARLDTIGLISWAPGQREHFVRIVPGIVTGRRLHHAGLDGRAQQA